MAGAGASSSAGKRAVDASGIERLADTRIVGNTGGSLAPAKPGIEGIPGQGPLLGVLVPAGALLASSWARLRPFSVLKSRTKSNS